MDLWHPIDVRKSPLKSKMPTAVGLDSWACGYQLLQDIYMLIAMSMDVALQQYTSICSEGLHLVSCKPLDEIEVYCWRASSVEIRKSTCESPEKVVVKPLNT